MLLFKVHGIEESLHLRKKKLLADSHTAQGGGEVKRGSKAPAVNTNSRCQRVANAVLRDWSLCANAFSLERASVWVSFLVNGQCYVPGDR